MSGMTTANMDRLTRSELWSNQLKDVLEDELGAQKWVDWMTEFPDGNTFTIPSVGQATTQDIQEDQAVRYSALDTGEFNFTITEYLGSAHYMTRKALQDSFYAQRVLSSFVPKEARAIGEYIETHILKSVGPNAAQGGQTSASANQVNGFDHRFLGTGTNDTIAVEDFAYAKLALKKANVPLTQLVAIVDPTVAYELETASNLTNFSNNPQWEGIVTTGLTNGMRFVRNIFGFDIWESNYLDTISGGESITGSGAHGSQTSSNDLKQCLMFSAAQGYTPIIGAWRQMPIVDSEFNKDLQREEYLTTCRFGVKLYWPENMICVLHDATNY